MVTADPKIVARLAPADLAWHEREDWALAAAKLRDVVRSSEGDAKDRAKAVLTDHYDNRGKPAFKWCDTVRHAEALAADYAYAARRLGAGEPA